MAKKDNQPQTRYLTLVRHAKSSWEKGELSDHDRPLEKRGRKDRKIMAPVIEAECGKPQRIISSSAARAQQTIRGLIKLLDWDVEVETLPALYTFDPHEVREVIMQLKRLDADVMMIGHNPAFEQTAQWLCGKEVERMATLAVVRIRLNQPWKELSKGSGELVWQGWPKMYK